MLQRAELQALLDKHPRAEIGHMPTPLDKLKNISAREGLNLWAKRDDCTGVAMGGNKVRQLRYYMGAAQAANADTVFITGAIQSNFVRTTAAMAGICGMDCHVQLEERVPDVSELHRTNGNVLLDRLMGATVHSYPEGEDEAGADAEMRRLADGLIAKGKRPYVVHLGADKPPLGALGYVEAALELAGQLDEIGPIDEIVIPSGSALTHIGALSGLRLLGIDIPVRGACVRRVQPVQTARVTKRIADLGKLLGVEIPLRAQDVFLDDSMLAPGYGQFGEEVRSAIGLAAKHEGLFVDPVYSGKTLATALETHRGSGRNILFWHTGGQPAMFAYADKLV